MHDFLKTTLETSVFICIIALLRRLLLQKLPKKTFLTLWIIALFRLLIPVSIPSPLSIYALLGNTNESPAAVQPEPLTAGFPRLTATTFAAVSSPAPAASGNTFSIHSLLLLLWGIGVGIAAIYFLQAHFRFKRNCADSLPLDTPIIRKWLREHPMRRPIQIRQSDRISTPLTYGLFRPTILLPKTALYDPKQLTYILLHEYTHIRRFDILLKWLFTAALCLYWYNPFVHLMVRTAMQDIELACDETVIQTCGEQIRSAYALTLLQLEETRIPLSPSCTCFSRSHAKERITAIMKMKKISVLTIVLALALVTGTVTVFATSCPTQEEAPAADQAVSIQMTTQEEYLRALEKSIQVQDSNFSFTLPAAYTEKISLWIAGRVIEGEVSMSAHYLTDESEKDSWESGKTYSFPLEGKLSELLMSVTLDGEETMLDLTGYLPEKHRYTETKPTEAPSNLSETYYSADAQQAAPSSEIQSELPDVPSELPDDIPEEEQHYVPNFPDESKPISELPAGTPKGQEYVPADTPSEIAYEYPAVSLCWPLSESNRSISVTYGERDHNGIDIVAEAGTSIYAASSGTILSTGFDAQNGNFVLIDHGVYQTLYCHCKSISVQEGDAVSAGDCIGTVGSTGNSTGPHLHFELQINDSTVNPMDYLAN